MKPCPCGCSRDLGWSDARVANSAGMVVQRLPMVQRTAELLGLWGSSEAATSSRFAADGARYATQVLRVAHGDHSGSAKQSMPRLGDGVIWVRKADQLRAALDKMDPDWVRWWRQNGSPPADLDGLGGWETWSGKLRGRQSSVPPPHPAPPGTSPVASPRSESDTGQSEEMIGGFLPETTVAYVTEAFVEGVAKLCEDVTPRPQPLLTIEAHAAPLFATYLEQRVEWGPLPALGLSIMTVLGETEGNEVLAFLGGERMDIYGSNAGYESFDLLLLMAEFWSGRMQIAPEVRNAELMAMSVPELCEELAGDGLRVGRFCIAYGNDNRAAVAEQTSEVATLITARCNEGVTPEAKRSCLQSAVEIFGRHATEAEASGPNGHNQFLWCRVVGAGIAGLLKE